MFRWRHGGAAGAGYSLHRTADQRVQSPGGNENQMQNAWTPENVGWKMLEARYVAQGDGAMNNWQPIETAPKDGSLFLAFNETMNVYCVVGWDCLDKRWTDEGGGSGLAAVQFNKNYFSHWMPLPAPPPQEPKT